MLSRPAKKLGTKSKTITSMILKKVRQEKEKSKVVFEQNKHDINNLKRSFTSLDQTMQEVEEQLTRMKKSDGTHS